ncbi:MAG TPA: biotin/lipoyl-binding protein [Candidatus Paceibacterota bacterium]
MKDKIEKLIAYFRSRTVLSIGIVSVLILAAGSVFAPRKDGGIISDQVAMAVGAGQSGVADMSNVAVVGDESLANISQPGNSWPGEVISYGNVPVQPGREGTIVEWRVKIGDYVNAGQVLARLSAPPAMPELVGMLAEQAMGRSRMQSEAVATKRFTEANNEQLRALLQIVEKSTNASDSTTSIALSQFREAVTIMGKNIRTMLDQALTKHMSVVSNSSTIASYKYGSLNRGYGLIDPQNQNTYDDLFVQLARSMKDPAVLPVDLATSYFASFARLGNTTLDGELEDIREMATDDQDKFLDMLAKYREAEAELTMKEGEYAMEYADQKKEISEKISENEKMLSMAEAEARASEVAYSTLERSINGGLAIVAPRSGVISTINRKIGDFVEPGMPVASVDTQSNSEKFVRLQIPNNIRTPKVGTILSVVRPGFAKDVQKVKLTGVGTSLDTTGAYMADASFLVPTSWPVSASVRVLLPQDESTPLVKLSAVWWSTGDLPHVWGVSSAGRLFARNITIGRALGASVEVYEGLKNGDRYVINPTVNMKEDMLLETRINVGDDSDQMGNTEEEKPMGGMEM